MTTVARPTVLVTGGSGRLGRVVVDELAGTFDVVVADLLPSAGWDGASVSLDVRDLAAVTKAVAEVDAVVHLAALDYDTHAAPEDFIEVNVLGTWNVLQACADQGVRRAVVCSSVAALGLHELRSEWVPLSLPVAEVHDPRPTEAYSVSKLIAETMAEAFVRAHPIDVLCIRPAAVIFPHQFEAFMRTVDPEGPGLFDYVTAEDVATAITLAIDGGWQGFDVVTLCADDSAHPDPTLEWYPRVLGPLPPLSDPHRYVKNQRASVYDNHKASTLLGWKPTSSFLAIERTRGEVGR